MSLHWDVNLECSDCGAALRYADERPDWQEDEEVKAELETARQWVQENPKISHTEALRPRPPFTRWGLWSGETSVVETYTRYVACPACGGKAYPENPDA